MSSELSVTWAKKPSNPSNRSRSVLHKKAIDFSVHSTVEKRAAKRLCQKCSLQGIQSALQLFQLNDNEAILMCKNVDCTFMSSPQWENLVVARNTSRLSFGGGSKKTSSLRKTQSVFGVSQSISTSTRQTHSLVSKPSLSGLCQSSESSRSSSPFGDPSKFEEEKQTLVPIAPFLSGQAHTFSSFATKRIEKEQLYNRPTALGNSFDKETFTPRNRTIASNHRRPNSVESESVSSGSLDSRPASPTSQIPSSLAGRKVRKVVVAPETLAKILDGSLQVKFVHSNKAKLGNPVSHSSSKATASNTHSVSGSIEKSIDSPTSTSQPHQLSVQDTEKQSSQSHIDAINSFIDRQSIDFLDFSHFVPIAENSIDHFEFDSFQLDDQKSAQSSTSNNLLNKSGGCMDLFDL